MHLLYICYIHSLPRLISMTSLFATHLPNPPLLTIDTTTSTNTSSTTNTNNTNSGNNTIISSSISSSSSSSGSQPINRLKLVVSTLGAHGSVLLRKRVTSSTHTKHTSTTIVKNTNSNSVDPASSDTSTTNTSHATTHATTNINTHYNSNKSVNNNSNTTCTDNNDSSSNSTTVNTGVVMVPSRLLPDSWVETMSSKSTLIFTQGVLRVTSSNCEKGHNYEDYDVIQ